MTPHALFAKICTETNPIERIWWRMHETLTRNHRCHDINQLLRNIYEWIGTQQCFFTQSYLDH